MAREIYGLSPKAYDRLIEDIPNVFTSKRPDLTGFTVSLNEYVILTSYSDSVCLDLGGHKSFMTVGDYILIEI